MKTRELLHKVAKPGVPGLYMLTIAGAFRILPAGREEPLCPIRFVFWLQHGCSPSVEPPSAEICGAEMGLSREDVLTINKAADQRFTAENLGHNVDASNIRRMFLILCGRTEEIRPDVSPNFVCRAPIGAPNDITKNITDAILAAGL